MIEKRIHKTTYDFIGDVFDKFKSESDWIQHSLAVDSDGNDVENIRSERDSICSMCLLGAFRATLIDYDKEGINMRILSQDEGIISIAKAIEDVRPLFMTNGVTYEEAFSNENLMFLEDSIAEFNDNIDTVFGDIMKIKELAKEHANNM